MLNKILILLGITDETEENKIKTLLENVEDEIKAYCDIEDITPLKSVIPEMVIYKYNQINAGGITSESYNGASFSYSSDYPPNITAILNKNRKARVM